MEKTLVTLINKKNYDLILSYDGESFIIPPRGKVENIELKKLGTYNEKELFVIRVN